MVGGCALAAGGSGELDKTFSSDLRAWVAPDHVALAADGRAWIGDGFDRAEGRVTGDLLRLGGNGRVAGEPAPGYLGKQPALGIGYAYVPFLLENGDFLLAGESGGWLRMNAEGESIGKGFPDRQPGEAITPLFENGGKLCRIRRSADGRRVLERRWGSRRVDGRFSHSATDVLGAVPGPDGGAWVLAGADDLFAFGGTPVVRREFRTDAAGNIAGEPLDLVPAPEFRWLGKCGARDVSGCGRAVRERDVAVDDWPRRTLVPRVGHRKTRAAGREEVVEGGRERENPVHPGSA